MSIEKILVHNIAATLTASVVGNLPDNLPMDAEFKDDSVPSHLRFAAEVHKVFYKWIATSLADDTWITPKVSLAGLLATLPDAPGSIGDALKALLSKLAPVLGPVVGPIAGAAAAAVTPKADIKL